MKLWSFLLKNLVLFKKVLLINCLLFPLVSLSSTHILFLGDSLSEGYGLPEEQSFPRLVEKKLKARKKDVVITNGGVSGSTTASGLTRLKWHLKKKTDIVVLELGANDGLRGLNIPASKKNLVEIIRYARNKKIKVLLLGLLLPPNYGSKYVEQFRNMYSSISKEEKVPMLPFLLEPVAGKPELNLPDGIHPNAKGHDLIADLVAPFLEKHL